MSPAQPTPAVKAELAHQPRPETAVRPAAVERLLTHEVIFASDLSLRLGRPVKPEETCDR